MLTCGNVATLPRTNHDNVDHDQSKKDSKHWVSVKIKEGNPPKQVPSPMPAPRKARSSYTLVNCLIPVETGNKRINKKWLCPRAHR